MKKAIYREGKTTLLILILFAILIYYFYPKLTFIGITAILFVLYFFRDPERKVVQDPNIIYAPADGVITDIETKDDDKFLKNKVKVVSIFMSPLNVHINRSPIKGKVEETYYQKGKFMHAKKKESRMENEKNYIVIANQDIRLVVVQIAGALARRIVNWTQPGDYLEQGARIGMIKFSSGTQLILPEHVELLVQKGENVYAGITKIGRIR